MVAVFGPDLQRIKYITHHMKTYLVAQTAEQTTLEGEWSRVVAVFGPDLQRIKYLTHHTKTYMYLVLILPSYRKSIEFTPPRLPLEISKSPSGSPFLPEKNCYTWF